MNVSAVILLHQSDVESNSKASNRAVINPDLKDLVDSEVVQQKAASQAVSALQETGQLGSDIDETEGDGTGNNFGNTQPTVQTAEQLNRIPETYRELLDQYSDANSLGRT